MAAERRDGPAGQGAVGAHQEAGHRPAGREGQERQRQRGTLRNTHTTVIKAVQKLSTGHTHWITVLQWPLLYNTISNIPILPATPCEFQPSCLLWCMPLATLTEAFCTNVIFCIF